MAAQRLSRRGTPPHRVGQFAQPPLRRRAGEAIDEDNNDEGEITTLRSGRRRHVAASAPVAVAESAPETQSRYLAETTSAFLSKIMAPRYALLVDRYVSDALETGFSPTVARVAAYIYVESEGQVSTAQTRRYLRLRFPEYTRTLNVRHRGRYGTMRTLFGHALGNYAIDLGFFSKTVAGFSRAQHACHVVYCCSGSRLLLLETIYRNRSAASILRALGACQQRLIDTYGRPEGFRRLYADQEGGLKSKLVKNWLRTNGIELCFYTSSNKKSYLAERAIRTVRVELERQRIALGNSFNPYNVLSRIEHAHNTRKLTLNAANNRPSDWSPADVTSETYERFITELFKLKPISYFGLFSLGEGYINYKFALDAYVYLKRAFVSSDKMEKRSVQNVDTDQLYSVAARYTIVTASSSQLAPYYRILPVFDYIGELTSAKIEAALSARGLFVPEIALASQ